MVSKVYIETTIVSYLAARPSRDLIIAAHQQLTQEWWDVRRRDFDLYISQLVVQEAGAGNPIIAKQRLQLVEEISQLELNEETLALARMMLDRGAVPANAPEDALHICLAAVHGMDYLLTWNCKHIANAQVQKMIASVCRASGYEPPVLCTPEELMGE